MENEKFFCAIDVKIKEDSIPYLQFPSSWQIKIIPPPFGATIRFRVKKKNGTKEISVYLDCYDNLAYVGYHYWKIYPDEFGEASRFKIDEINELIEGIEKSLNVKG